MYTMRKRVVLGFVCASLLFVFIFITNNELITKVATPFFGLGEDDDIACYVKPSTVRDDVDDFYSSTNKNCEFEFLIILTFVCFCFFCTRRHSTIERPSLIGEQGRECVIFNIDLSFVEREHVCTAPRRRDNHARTPAHRA